MNSISKAKRRLEEFRPILEKATDEIRVLEQQLEVDEIDYKRMLIKNLNVLLKVEVDYICEAYNDLDPVTGLVKDSNLYNLDQYLRKLPYFVKFHPEIRRKLIKHAKLKFYERGDYIFKEGEEGTNMFVILYGSVNVLVKKTHPAFKNPYDTVNFL